MTDFSKLENYHHRMTTAISELKRLSGDDESDDFIASITLSYGEIVRNCEHRREVVQRRKYGK